MSEDNNNLIKIINHLEFIGFTIEREVGPTGLTSIFATRNIGESITIADTSVTIMFMYFIATHIDKYFEKHIKDLHQLLNNINYDYDFIKASLSKDNKHILFATPFIGNYDKKNFGQFIELYLRSILDITNTTYNEIRRFLQ